MKKTIIAPVGDHMESLFVGIKDFPTEKVVLITPIDMEKEATKARGELEKFRIPVEIIKINNRNPIDLWEEMFKTVARLKRSMEGKDILINVATGDRTTRCAATSAAFVNGLQAIATDDEQAMLLPVLKFNYYKLLNEKKMMLLHLLQDGKCCDSLEELSKKSGMSLPLISYHINGTPRSQGLKEFGLVETEEVKGRIRIRLSMLGRLLLRGYVDTEIPRKGA